MLKVVGTLALAYGAVVVAARLGFRHFLYPAPQNDVGKLPAGATLLTRAAVDGVPVHVAFFPGPGSSSRTLVHFHGNGETIANNLDLATVLHARGLGVALVEYRGYGISRGAAPSEAGLYLDALAALDALAEHGVDGEHVVLWGTSLGSGVAAEMARRKRGSSLVLVSPFTSMPKVAARHMPLLPMPLVITDRYDTLAKAQEIRMPTLVVHGAEDEIVPYDMGQRLAAAIPGATLVTIPGGHHNDLFFVDGARIVDAIAAHAKR